MVQKFGSRDTGIKLGVIDDYVRAYLIIVSKHDLWTTYVDAFAGSGHVKLASASEPLLPGLMDAEQVIKGSALRVLSQDRAFDQYLFIDTKKRNLDNLRTEINKSYPSALSKVSFKRADANAAIADFCKSMSARDRAVIFLDPFGNQVEWKTIELIAATGKIDLWYLFPSGLGVNRQISTDGSVHDTHVSSLNRVIGTTDWPTAFLSQEIPSPDLFGHADEKFYKTASTTEITEYVINRMKKIFRGGVSDEWLPLERDRS